MREDPIILEDWKPGYPSGSFYFPYNVIDYLATTGILGTLVGISIYERNFSVLFLNLLVLLLYTIVILIVNENQRSAGVRVIEIAFLVIWVFLMPYSNWRFETTWLLGTFFFIRLMTTSILLQLLELRDEIFIPKTNVVKERLENALLNLEVTDYNIDPLEILESKNSIVKTILPIAGGIYILTSGIYYTSKVLSDDWLPFVQFLFLFFDLSAIIILGGFLFLWGRRIRGRKRGVSQPESSS